MRVPFYDLRPKAGWLDPIIPVVQSGQFVRGEQVAAFEREFADYYHDCERCVATGSGTDALIAAICALGLHDAEILCPAVTFVATAEAIVHAGAIPVFVDVDDDGLMDLKQAESLIKPGRTKGMIVVHLHGLVKTTPLAYDFSVKYDLTLIEDCAHTGPPEDDAPQYAEAHCYSFYPTKILGAWGNAGAVVTSEEIGEIARAFTDHGRFDGHHRTCGYTGIMDELQAAVLRSKLPLLGAAREKRSEAAIRYYEQLKDVEEILLPRYLPGRDWYVYAIQVPRREQLRDHLRRAGIETGIHYRYPVPAEPAFMGFSQRGTESFVQFPKATYFCARTLSLPFYPGIPEDHVDYVCEKVKEFFSQGGSSGC